MTDRDDWVKRKDLESEGFDLKPPAVRVHGRNETPKHLAVKAMLALALQKAGRRWDTEVKTGAGRVDVLDLGPPDGPPLVYEVETGVTPKKREEKSSQYTDGPVRDVMVIDPTNAPDEPGAILDWLEDNHLTGL